MDLLKELCECSGIPGREERLREIARRELTPLSDEVRVDAMGSLIALKKATQGEGKRKRKGAGEARKLMIAAHMDEIGFVVSHIDDKGWIRLVPVGGHNPRNMVAQRVIVCAPKGDLLGLLYPGVRPPHIATAEDLRKELKIGDFFVDLGLPAEEVKKQVEVGSPVVIHRNFTEIGNGVSCKAMDDRVALYVMIEAMRKAKSFGFDTYAVATVQEEVGLRGALTSAYGISPDAGVALDTTLAVDIPGVPEHEKVTALGEGVAIKILDSSFISHPGLVQEFKRLAKKRKIEHQMEILPQGGTDAGAIQRVQAGVPVITLSIPTRYIHTSIEMSSRSDISAAIDLLAAFIEEGQKADLKLV
ncbi:MAG: M42 family metallopeptidase [Candidatus Latescibacterota bacterium]|nr:M42 family metallopeptidase [Candidatus Latescibacterota bacterium]